MDEPRGVQEQVKEISDLLNPEVEDVAGAGAEQQEGNEQQSTDESPGRIIITSLRL